MFREREAGFSIAGIMQKSVKCPHICLYALVVFCAMTFPAKAASFGELVENVELLAIKSIQVRIEERATYLDILALIVNKNDDSLKVRDRELTFFISPLKQGADTAEVDRAGEELGVDRKREEVMLEPEAKMLLLTPEAANDMLFQVNMGRRDADISASLAHLLNALGNPAHQAPLITIAGSAEVGLFSQTEKQWKFKASRIEWTLQPKIQPRFLLYYGSSE